MDREESIRRLVEARKPKEKKARKPIAKKSAKTLKREAEEKKAASAEGREESLNEWFQRIEDKHWGKQDLDIDGFDHEESEFELPRCMECNAKIPRIKSDRRVSESEGIIALEICMVRFSPFIQTMFVVSDLLIL